MNDIIKFQRTIESSFRRSVIVTSVAIVAMAAVAAVVSLRSYSLVGEQRRQI